MCHTDDYVGKHFNIGYLNKKLLKTYMKGREVMTNNTGQRIKKNDEPMKEMAHQDFLLKEM